MTTENLFSAVLTFSLMAGGAVAFGSEMLGAGQARQAVQVVTLPTVTIVGQRAQADRLTMPTVTVTGRREAPTRVAAETGSVEQQRVQ